MRNTHHPQSKLPWVTFLFIFLVFFLATGITLPKNIGEDTKTGDDTAHLVEEGTLSRRIAFLCLGSFGIFRLIKKRGERIRINGSLSWLIIFFLVWAGLSITWSEDIALTFRRLVVLAIFCLGALAVGKSLSLRHIIWFVFFSTSLFLIVGLSTELTLGSFNPFTSGYRFGGTLHPNFQGINCALLLIATVALMNNARRGSLFFLTIALVALVFLILTKSRTSFMSAILSIFTYWSFVLSGSRKSALILCFGIISCLLLLIFGDTLFPIIHQAALLGRDSSSAHTLTGRIPLWKECLEYAAGRLLQGYGYESFWTPRNIAEISATQGWAIPIGHSAYLDIFLGVGSVGMIGYVLIIIVAIKSSFDYFRSYFNNSFLFLGMLLVFCGLNGLLESSVIQHTFLGFLQMTVLAKLGFFPPSKYPPENEWQAF